MPLTDHPNQTYVFYLILPMELHLMLGVVNHLLKAIREIWPKANGWPRVLYI